MMINIFTCHLIGKRFCSVTPIFSSYSVCTTSFFKESPAILQRSQINPSYLQCQYAHSDKKSRGSKKKYGFQMSNATKVTLGLGLGLGAYLIALDRWRQSEKEAKLDIALRSDGLPYLTEKPPEHKVARSIVNPKDASGLKLTLYQYQTCPFCCKVRAFLNYFGFSYDVVEVNSVTKKDVKWTSYKKVPFLVIEVPGSEYGESKFIQLKDSSVIISVLASVLRNPNESLHTILESFPSYYDKDNSNRLEFANRYFIMYTETKDLERKQKYIKLERRWRQWIDDKFVHTLSPNIYRTPTESLQAFKWFSQTGDWENVFSTWERLLIIYSGAAVMWVIGKRLKKRHNISDDPRLALYDLAKLWMQEIKPSEGPFAGGKLPNLADVSMYGVLTSIEGCDAWEDLLSNTSIGDWFYRMKEEVDGRKGEYKLVARCAIR